MSTALLVRPDELNHGDFRELQRDVLVPLAKRFPALNEADLEDIWQLAQIKVFDRQARGEEIENLAGLLWRVSFYEALSLLKFNNRRNAMSDLSDHSEFEQTAIGTHDATDKIAANELFETIREVLNSLPERRRQFIVLRFVEELPATQIASLYDVLVRTVHREIDKAIDAIAISVARDWNVEGVDRKRIAELVTYSVDTLSDRRSEELRVELAQNPALAAIAHELGFATRRAAATMPLPFIPLSGDGGGRSLERLLHLFSGSSSGVDSVAQGTAAGGATIGGGLLATAGGKIAVCIGATCLSLLAIPAIKSYAPKQNHSAESVQKRAQRALAVQPRLRTTLRDVAAKSPPHKPVDRDKNRTVSNDVPTVAEDAPAKEPGASQVVEAPVTPVPKPSSEPKPTGEFEVQ